MTARLAQLLFIAIISFTTVATLKAQTWDTIPPPMGGEILSFARTGSTQCVVVGSYDHYTQEYDGHLFRSIDDGDSWVAIPSPVDSRAYYHHIALGDSNYIYYMTEENLYGTSDNGQNWTDIGSGLGSSGSYVQLACDSNGWLYVLSLSFGLRVSTDRGATWQARSFPSGSPITIFTCIEITVDDNLYAWWRTSESRTLFRSTDQGISWHSFATGKIPFAVTANGNGMTYVGLMTPDATQGPAYITKTVDDGASWNTVLTVNALLNTFYHEGKKITISSDGALLFTYFDSTFTTVLSRSTDDGVSWQYRKIPTVNSLHRLHTNARGNVLFTGILNGLLILPTFTGDLEQQGFMPMPVNCTLSITESGDIFGYTVNLNAVAAMIQWDASDAEWTLANGLPVEGAHYVNWGTHFLLAQPDTMFQGKVYGVLPLERTTDRGKSWNALQPPIRANAVMYGNATYREGRWYAASMDSLYMSEDQGRGWSVTAIPRSQPRSIAEVDDTIYLATRRSGLWRSTHFGAPWTKLPSSTMYSHILAADDGTLYQRRDYSGHLNRSQDGGQTWEDILSGDGTAHGIIVLHRDTVIVIDSTKGILVSLDKGDTWMRRVIPGLQPRSLVLRGEHVYLGTKRKGIVRIPLADLTSVIALQFPVNNADCQPLEVGLSWSVADPSKPCRVRCGTDESLLPSSIHIDTVVTGSALSVTSLNPGTQYFWEVAVEGSEGDTTYSCVWGFSTAGLDIPDVFAPENNDLCISPENMIEWIGQSCVIISEVEIATDSAFQNVIIADSTSGEQSSLDAKLQFGQEYYLRVRRRTQAGMSPWSATVHFATLDDTTTASVQEQPLDNEVITNTAQHSIIWAKPECVKLTEVIVSNDPGFAQDTVIHDLKNGPTYRVAIWSTWPNDIYYWKVRAWRDTVPGYWSDTWSFTLDRPVSVEPEAKPHVFNIAALYPQPVGSASSRGESLLNVEFLTRNEKSVVFELYDLLGRRLLREFESNLTPGRHLKILPIGNLPSGTYLLALKSRQHLFTRTIVVMN